MQKYAIIVAGGSGSRVGAEIPKQFLPLSGKPLLVHSIESFFQYDSSVRIIIALNPAFKPDWEQMKESLIALPAHRIVDGGDTRFQSVKNALAMIDEPGWVAVHDAARPLVTLTLIGNAFSEAMAYGNAIPSIPVNETVRTIAGGKAKIVDRKDLRIIQTPQVFETGLLKEAYQQPFIPSFTDDASVVEAMGKEIHLFPGDPHNMKITLPGDLEIAELLAEIGNRV